MTLHVTLRQRIGCLRLYWQVPTYLIHCYEQNRRASATARYSTSNSVADAYQKSPLEKQPRVRTPREVGLTFYFYSQDHDSHESDAVPICYSRRKYQLISNIVSSSYAGGAANFFGFSQVSSMAEDDLSAKFNAAMGVCP